ncbi:MAG TPA: hypothetical protein VI685_15395 [Candidatus Angelobacter sp.]
MKKPFTVLATSVAVIAFLPLFGQKLPATKTAKTTVCRLAAAPQQFDSTLVTLRARVESDGMHGAVLTEKACPDKGVLLSFDKSSDNQSATAFTNALFSGVPGTTDKEITGVFTGTFHWDKDKVPNRALTVHRISNLRVKKISDPPIK